MSAKNTSNKSSEKLLNFAVNFLNFFLKNIVDNEKQFAQDSDMSLQEEFNSQ